MTETKWEWIPGKIDLSKRYFELKYGNRPAPVARIGIADDQKFIVEFMLPPDDDRQLTEEMLKEIIYEIELYLINNSVPDPLTYMINHTYKCANLYSRVHWVYFPRGAKKSIALEKKSNFNNSFWGLKKFFSKN
jgi:hypothetical protein